MKIKSLSILLLIFLSIALLGCQSQTESQQYTIVFNSNGGSQVQSIIIDEDETWDEPETPIKEGWVFDGWYLDNDQFSIPFDLETMSIVSLNQNVTLYAKWTYNEAFIQNLHNLLNSGEDVSNLLGVSVSFDGTIIGEAYFNSLKRDHRYNLYSATKSITSLLVGIAIDHGHIEDVNQSIGDYIDLSSYEHEEDLSNIKIKHLLSMSSGIYWNNNDLPSEMVQLRTVDDPLDFILNRPIIFSPGENFNYSDGSSHLMSIIFSEATGMTLSAFADQYLFEPLDIDNINWGEDQVGNNIGGSDLLLSNHELDRIGQLVINHGMYHGEQIVSSNWIETSTQSQDFSVSYYGYYWWLSTYQGYDIIAANGYGGQHIIIVPELDVVVTTLASAFVFGDDADHQYDAIEDFIYHDILDLFIDHQSNDE